MDGETTSSLQEFHFGTPTDESCPGILLAFAPDGTYENDRAAIKDTFSVGRDKGCDITVLDGALSRNHFEIKPQGDVLLINDLGSKNGTLLNAEKLRQPAALKDQDIICAGMSLFVFVSNILPFLHENELRGVENTFFMAGKFYCR